MPQLVTFYTDGSCRPTVRKGFGRMGAGIVALCGEHRKTWSVPLGDGTNQIAELLAVEFALNQIPDLEQFEVTVVTDSQYVVGLLTQNWDARANTEIVARLRALVKRCSAFKAVHVPGHAGHSLNEEAHNLAAQATKEEAPSETETAIDPAVQRQIDDLQEEVALLVQTLQAYADPLAYTDGFLGSSSPQVVKDNGKLARRVLEQLGYPAVSDPFEEPAGECVETAERAG